LLLSNESRDCDDDVVVGKSVFRLSLSRLFIRPFFPPKTKRLDKKKKMKRRDHPNLDRVLPFFPRKEEKVDQMSKIFSFFSQF